MESARLSQSWNPIDSVYNWNAKSYILINYKRIMEPGYYFVGFVALSSQNA